MRLARLHRRLSVGAALAALGAFAAGAGWSSPAVLLAGVGLLVAMVWQPREGVWIERGAYLVALPLFGWLLYVFARGGDPLPPVLALMLFLLVAEALRPLPAENDLRLYALAFALLIAATAFSPGITFAAAFLGYVGLATLALMVGHLRRQAESYAAPEPRLGGALVWTTGALSVITVAMSAGVFLLFPRLPHAMNGWSRPGAGEVMTGFGDEVSLAEHGGRILPNPEVVLRVEFPDGPPPVEERYWRGRAFDHFDGVRWSRSPELPFSAVSPQLYWTAWGEPVREQTIYGGPRGARVLFGMHPVLDVRPHSRIRPGMDAAGDVQYQGEDALAYTVLSAAPRPPEAALRAATDEAAPAEAFYLQLPPLSERVRQLSDSLTQGHATRYERVLAVERFFRTGFRYTLDLPATAREATLEHFLFERRAGHCEYYSTAMVVLLRAAGIPARNVNGFLGGTWREGGGYLAVTQNDAHSWVEVWFPQLGWVPFDPTPPGERGSALASHAPSSWRWPLRLWWDGAEHRWRKWVLEYDLQKQIQAFRALSDALAPQGGEQTPRLSMRPLLPWLLGGLGLVGVGAVLRRRRERHPEQTRLYLALRRSYRRAGMEREQDPPLAFRRALGSADAPGRTSAERLIDRYLRSRFGGETLSEGELQQMRADLRAVRDSLRSRSR